MKPIKFTSDWGSTEVEPSPKLEHERIYFTIRGPRGGDPRSDYLSPVEALALARYLETWALEMLR